jgi:hypothetical protein
MIDEIVVIDNVIPSSMQNQIEDLFTSGRLGWIFFKDIAVSPEDIRRLNIKKLTPGIACYIKQDNPKFLNEQLYNIVKMIPEAACKHINKQCLEIHNARSFMHFPLNDELRKEYDNVHIDVHYPHLVVLYYVNDTDGDTFIFDKTTADCKYITKDTKLNVLKKVSPKKGRVVVFNGNRYHSSSGPTKDVRCIINFNVKI